MRRQCAVQRSRRRLAVTRIVLTLVFSSAFAATAWAQAVEELFVHVAPAAQTAQAHDAGVDDPRSAVIDRMAVGVRIDALFDRPDGPTRAIALNVGDHVWIANFDRLESDVSGFRSWVGHVRGVDESHVVITERAGVLSGLITAAERTYQLRTVAPGVAHSLERVDVTRLPAETEPLAQDSTHQRTSGAATADTVPGDGIVDVLILYTPGARSRLGGTPQIQALASQVISDTNSAFVRSGVVARVRLTAAHEVALTEATSMQTDLSTVRWSPDARFLRDAYHADLVQLLVSSPDMSTCGAGYLFANDALDFDAYSVADVTCVAQYTPTHEMGHNFGSHHAPEDGAAGALFPYSYALKDPARGFRTIMAYACPEAPCPRVPIFSNPGIRQNDGPAGSALQNNARSLSEAAPFVANFRRSMNSTNLVPPGVPLGLSANVAGNNVSVTWTPALGGPESAPSAYVLQVGSSPGGSNVFNASIGNVTSASGAVPFGTYFWRVIALNGAGQSPPSPEAQFVVGCATPPPPGNFSFSVSNRVVTLTWAPASSVGLETYVIEAGSAPSFANLLISAVGAETSVTTPAPPGTYYVRIRARSACGTSAPSNEQTIVVP
jgi:hypothetical protein